MTSNEVEIEQSTTELKYLGLLKKIVVRFVAVPSNVYDFAKENAGDFKTTIVSVENTVVPTFGPVYKNLKDLTEQTLVFVDDKVEIEQSTTELKYLGLLKKIVVRFVAVPSNVYDFAKENAGDFKTTIVSVENTVVPTFGPVYKNLKDLTEQTLVFVDDKFDKYAPSFAKKLATEFESLLYEAKPIAKRIVTTTQSVTTPPITATIFLLQTTKYFIQSITPLQNRPTTTTETPPVDTTKTPAPGTIFQTGTDLANQVAGGLMGNITQSLNPADLANQVVGGLMGNVTQSLTNPTDLANQVGNTTNSLVSNNPLLGAVDKGSSAVGDVLGGVLSAAGSVVGGGLSAAGDIAGGGLSTIGDVVGEVDKGLSAVGDVLGASTGLSAVGDALGANTGLSAIGDPLRVDKGLSAVGDALRASTGLSAVGDALGASTGLSAVGDVLGANTGLSDVGDALGVSTGLSAVGDALGASTGLLAVGDALGANTGLSAIGDALGVDKGLSAVGDALGASTGLSAVGDALGASTGLSAFGDALGASTGLSAVGGLFGINKSK